MTFAPFDFERVARAPDGSERKVAFSLAFTAHAALPHAGFFTCEHKFPENFWRAELQRHANGATGLAAVTMVAEEPAGPGPGGIGAGGGAAAGSSGATSGNGTGNAGQGGPQTIRPGGSNDPTRR